MRLALARGNAHFRSRSHKIVDFATPEDAGYPARGVDTKHGDRLIAKDLQSHTAEVGVGQRNSLVWNARLWRRGTTCGQTASINRHTDKEASLALGLACRGPRAVVAFAKHAGSPRQASPQLLVTPNGTRVDRGFRRVFVDEIGPQADGLAAVSRASVTFL
jgi:hypothetical protein